MIRPRPTPFPTIRRRDAYTAGATIDPFRSRDARYCQCGTRLRRTKPLWDTLCDACDHQRRLLLDIVAIVQEDVPLAEPKHHPTRTCSCGRPMYRQSVSCRVCYHERNRAKS